MTSAKESEWNRALEDLQMDFKILPIGTAEVGAWKYAFVYQISAFHYPDLPEQARHISESQARGKLLELFFNSVGTAQLRDVKKLLGWGHELTARAVGRLVESGKLIMAGHPVQKGEWLVLPELCK